jgi:rhodanese-related sulfurtransferase
VEIDLKTVFLIIFISSLMGLAYNYFSPSGIPIFPGKKTLQQASDSLLYPSITDTDKVSSTISKNEEIIEEPLKDSLMVEKERSAIKDGVKRKETIKKEDVQTEPLSINLKQAYTLYKRNTLFIDAREPEDYRIGHIKNAINIPADHFDDYEFKLDKIEKEQPIVTYCAGSDCDLSIVLGNILFDMGYKKIYVFFGGWNDWIDANYPIETRGEK